MKKYLKIICFVLLLCSYNESKASLQPLFKHLNAQNGLLSANINCVFKDHAGFLWLGTTNGLNRFDGKNVITYTHKVNDTTSLISNDIVTISEDDKGRLWVATRGGLSIFDPHKKTFSNYFREIGVDKEIHFNRPIATLNYFKGKMWVGLLDGIAWTNTDTIRFHLTSKEDLKTSKDKIMCIGNSSFTTKDGIWISTFQGLFYSKNGKTFFNKENNPNNWPIFKRGFVAGFCSEGDSLIYFCNWKFSGIYKFNYKLNKLDSIKIVSENFLTFRSLCKVNSNEIWAATLTEGIVSVNLNNGQPVFIQPDKTYREALSYSRVNQIIKDAEGTIFIATHRGLDYVNPLQTQFKIFRNQPDNEHSLPGKMFTALIEDANGIIWMSTHTEGLYSFDPSSGYTEHYSFDDDHDQIWSLYMDENKLMLGTEGGLAYFDIVTKKLKPINDLPEDVNDYLTGNCTGICKDRFGNYWFGMYQKGLLKYNFTTKESLVFSPDDSTHYIIGNTPQALFIDKHDNLWFGHVEKATLTCINLRTNAITFIKDNNTKNGISNGYISNIVSGNNDCLWIGTTQGGLFQFFPSTQTFKPIDTESGLSDNNIASVLTDNKNRLWISTFNGLNCLDQKTGKIISYGVYSGLPTNQFDDNVSMKDKNGNLYFACDLFLIKFDPDSLIENPYYPSLQFLSYQKSGVEYVLEPGQKDLDFSYREKVISFEFTAINYIDPEKNQFAFILEGYDNKWTYCDKRTFVSYSSLPPGDYVFKVKTTNHFNQWNVPEYKLFVHVTGPFWKTTWFFILCLIIVAGISFMIYKVRLNHLVKVQEIRNKISKDLHDDIGSALSSISIYSEVASQMVKTKAPEAIPVLTNLGESARTAMENMSDIVWAINPKNDRFSNIVQRLQIFANQLLEVKNINLHFQIPDDLNELKLSMQQRKNLYLIFKEAINNVAKYSGASNCFVILEEKEKKVNVQIKDDGQGFEQTTQTLGGNGLINMRQRVLELNGVFNIFSEKQKGTTIQFQFDS